MGAKTRQSTAPNRLIGLDLARFLAFLGMVLVNFKVATGASLQGAGPTLAFLHTALEGRAAALFVMLAGIGIGLGLAKTSRQEQASRQWIIAKRGLILFVFGMLNVVIFEADILHFYGLYFVLAIWMLPLGAGALLAVAVAMITAFPVVALIVGYDTGWNWATLQYTDFATIEGFARHSLINGWHPVLPWMAFLLVGMAIAKFDLSHAKTKCWLVGGGAGLMGIAQIASLIIESAEDRLLSIELEWPIIEPLFASLSPIPPSPLYMISATGSAMVALVFCLWLGKALSSKWLGAITATGKQALTLYIAHILIGMGILEEIGWIATPDNPSPASLIQATWSAALFVVATVVYAWVWQRYLGQGPLERLLRVLSR